MSYKNIAQRVRKTKERVDIYLLAKKVEKLEKQQRLQGRVNAHQVALNQRQLLTNESVDERLRKLEAKAFKPHFSFIRWLLAKLGR